ncbi:MAG: hypothetical protein IJ829_07945, partial [Kiritimatiellae bacterium]|nr:hypothetical protein [Kiritimatiellia bacterium]
GLGGQFLIGGSLVDDGYRLGDDLREWRPRLTASTGLFKGYIYLYSTSGRRTRATVSGVVVDGCGYGSATLRRTAAWPVEIVPDDE